MRGLLAFCRQVRPPLGDEQGIFSSLSRHAKINCELIFTLSSTETTNLPGHDGSEIGIQKLDVALPEFTK